MQSRNGSLDEYQTTIGFREGVFRENGFFLNGRHLKLRGLNRHQTYPYVGQAMPARVQKRDAWILKKELKCNIVRTSHYPQSPHFLEDRKSTRLNSSHSQISYAVFCLKKKK